MIQDKMNQLSRWIKESNNIVFFGGAGVSTESNIPDFRSVDGLYHMIYSDPPETILSHTFFIQKTKEFYRFYKDKMVYCEAIPNVTHKRLAEWETEGKLKGIITQNIDGLHQIAGSKNVLELHGSIYRNHCMNCNKAYELSDILKQEEEPRCCCGGLIKPDVVLYEEGLDQKILTKAIRLISQAEVLIIGGTSLSVYPAAGLIRYYVGNKMILINKSVTPYDEEANLLITAGLGEVFTKI
jgi:NAD-dependent deacetylase